MHCFWHSPRPSKSATGHCPVLNSTCDIGDSPSRAPTLSTLCQHAGTSGQVVIGPLVGGINMRTSYFRSNLSQFGFTAVLESYDCMSNCAYLGLYETINCKPYCKICSSFAYHIKCSNCICPQSCPDSQHVQQFFLFLEFTCFHWKLKDSIQVSKVLFILVLFIQPFEEGLGKFS